jgi:transcriptional regulator with XRE-family HTH domain
MAPVARKIPKSLHSPDQLAFRELMIQARLKAGLTQQALADRLGKHQSFIAKYERGERRLDVIEFLAIAGAMGADPVRLLRALIRRNR